jgi:glycosyltransferase involved in cell wall biosynthesis
MSPKVSVVVPIYKSADTIAELCLRLSKTLTSKKLSYEIILINDGSPDDSWGLIQQLGKIDRSIVGISFSRNFGQHRAIFAGLTASKGDWVVVMDADLQDRPEAIAELYQAAVKRGDAAVIAKRVGRHDGKLNKTTSKYFYKLLAKLSEVRLDGEQGNFGIYSGALIDTVVSFGDLDFFFPTAVKWSGFKQSSLEVHRDQRSSGESTYNFRRRLKLALRVLVVNSNQLLRFSIFLGLAASSIAAVAAIVLIFANLFGAIQVAGWTSVMVAIFFMGGTILMSNGVLGLYLGKVFDASKNRPRYVVADSVNLK